MSRAEGMCLRETWEDFCGVRVLEWSKACEFRLRKKNGVAGVWLRGPGHGGEDEVAGRHWESLSVV